MTPALAALLAGFADLDHEYAKAKSVKYIQVVLAQGPRFWTWIVMFVELDSLWIRVGDLGRRWFWTLAAIVVAVLWGGCRRRVKVGSQVGLWIYMRQGNVSERDW